MKEVTQVEFDIIKAYFQIQLLIYSLDDIEYESTKTLKHKTSNYLNFLKLQAMPILDGMYKSNPSLYDNIMKDLKENTNLISKYFIIKK